MGEEVTIGFKCSKCGVNFNLLEGGLCKYCNKFFCLNHYDAKIKVNKKRQSDFGHICEELKKKTESSR